MSHKPYTKSSKVSITYGAVTAMRDPIIDEELTTKRYVDAKIVVGDVKYSVRNTDHNGWLCCDGRSLSRTEYASLFAIIGTSFGSASGSTFNLPNCRGKVLGSVGQDLGHSLTERDLGDYAGSETHTLTTAQMPSHNHTGTTSSNGDHTHTITDPGHTHQWNNGTEGDDSGHGGSYGEYTLIPGSVNNVIASSTTGISVNSSGAHTHTFTTSSEGGGNSFSIMQPTLFIGNVFMFSGLE